VPAARLPVEQPTPRKTRWADALGLELTKLKGLAIAYLMGAARDVMEESLPPSMRDQIRETMDSITQKLGGAPVRGPVLGRGARGSASDSRHGEPGLEARTTRGSITEVPGRW